MVEPRKLKAAYKPSSLDSLYLIQAEQNGCKRRTMVLRGKFRSKF